MLGGAVGAGVRTRAVTVPEAGGPAGVDFL